MNWKDKTVFIGDNLPIMQGMNSESVDLIYLDPPFNSKRQYSAPEGTQAAGSTFKDTWGQGDVNEGDYEKLIELVPQLGIAIQATREVHGIGMSSYLIMMAARLIEMKRLLKETGSIYLHCDPTASHYLKLIMDAIFGEKNFRNEIIWSYRTGGVSQQHWPRKHDTLIFYVNSDSYNHNPLQERVHYEKAFFTSEQTADGKFFADVYIRDVWEDIKPLINVSNERAGYPTQKPLALLERIIEASSKRGEIVFDPFCGYATTLVAADRLQRKWIGIDISEKAVELVNERIKEDQGLFADITIRNDVPRRTDLEQL